MEKSKGQRPATTQGIVSGLGPSSATFRTATDALRHLYRLLQDDPALQLRIGQWRRYLALVYGDETGDDDLFLKHTYLATVARLLASLRLWMGALPSHNDLEGIIRGEYFQGRTGLANFVEEDLFTWFLSEPVRQEGLDLAWRLLNTLQTYDLSQVREDVLKELYQGLVDPETRHDLGEYYTPDWLAEIMLRDELRLPEDPHRTILDPACGSGTFLFIAIRLVRQALEKEGMAPADILEHILDSVVGMDVHPLAVTIARTNYLLALGDLLAAPRSKVTIPIYLADSIRLPQTTAALGEGGSYVIPVERNVTLQVPESLAMDPRGLDYLLPFMKNKYGGAALRAATPEAEARVWSSFHQFLITPTTSRKAFALDEHDAEIMMQTQRVLVDLMRQGKDTLWFFILRNALRPAILTRHKFDLVVGNPPWLSSPAATASESMRRALSHFEEEYEVPDAIAGKPGPEWGPSWLFFVRTADVYVKSGGTVAFIMPQSLVAGLQASGVTSFPLKSGGGSLRLRELADMEQADFPSNAHLSILAAEKVTHIEPEQCA